MAEPDQLAHLVEVLINVLLCEHFLCPSVEVGRLNILELPKWLRVLGLHRHPV